MAHKLDNEALNVIWEDRKHILWFPITFTRYTLTADKLYINTGCISTREDECLLYRVTDISLTRSLGQKICGTGTIELATKDRTTPIIRLENVKRSVAVKRMLSNLVEKERVEKNVVGADMYGAASHIDPPEMHGPHEHDFPF